MLFCNNFRKTFSSLIILLFIFFILPLSAFEFTNAKKEIEYYESLISQGELKSRGYKDLSLAYYKDQNLEKAFSFFLKALDLSEAQKYVKISDEEKKIYEAALKIYLNTNGEKLEKSIEKIEKEYKPIYLSHPDFYYLGYLIAVAEANLENYPDFFNHFYQSYLNLPEHYLAYKTKAILHAKIFDRTVDKKIKEKEREAILKNLDLAIEKNPEDTSLYKMRLTSTLQENKLPIVKSYLNKILHGNIMFPRSDIAFYVQQAVSVNQFDLAEKLIVKAREWYSYSRMIDIAEKYLKEHQ